MKAFILTIYGVAIDKMLLNERQINLNGFGLYVYGKQTTSKYTHVYMGATRYNAGKN